MRIFFTILLLLLNFAPDPSGDKKLYLRLFKVDRDGAVLKIVNTAGSIKVTAWDRAEIKVSALLADKSVEIKDIQVGSEVVINVNPNKMQEVNFEVYAPKSCMLDLNCLQGSITITAIDGQILAQTTEGHIQIQDTNSPNITAKSIAGRISYAGDLAQKGIYHFHSVENSVDVNLKPASAFSLMATAAAGSIDLGGFQLNEMTFKEKWVAGKYGQGGASLNLSTHRGKISLRKAGH